MASEFIGYTVLVTLRSPPDAKIRGIVAHVDPFDQRLQLRDVLLWNGHHVPDYTIKSHLIADLEVSPPDLNDQGRDLYNSEVSLPDSQLTADPIQPQLFVDPAILSFAKPTHSKVTSAPVQLPSDVAGVSPIMIADGAVSHSTITTYPALGSLKQSSVSSIATTLPASKSPRVSLRKESSASATLTQPFDALALEDEISTLQNVGNGQNRNTRKMRKSTMKSLKATKTAGVLDWKDVSGIMSNSGKQSGKGKGWRQTPLVEDSLASRTGNQKKTRNKPRKSTLENPNGWAIEDTTDIQEMGEFDFEENLSKFDKKAIFNDIRRDDTTADSDRLVSFNRLAKPGTNGGRNLHYSENVLDPDLKDGRWKSEAGETEDEVREEHYSSGRGSRKSGSKLPPPSRRGSAFPGNVAKLRTESPVPMSRTASLTSPLNGSLSGIRASFRLAGSKKPCPCISPLQMLEIEQVCVSELGLTEEVLSENAGRSVAEAIWKIADPNQTNEIMFLIGNHKSGARAVAAAKHLRNRKFRVAVCVLGGEREDMLLEALRKQLSIYKKGNGYVEKWDEFQSKLSSGSSTPYLIVDALLGMHVAFDELRTDDQATAFEMTSWANRSAAKIVSIDVPSGFDAASGLATDVDGEPLVVNSTHVVCLGIPKIGLLSALASETVNFQVSVADIGISVAAWSKHGSRRRHGPEFGAEWVVPLRLVTGAESL